VRFHAENAFWSSPKHWPSLSLQNDLNVPQVSVIRTGPYILLIARGMPMPKRSKAGAKKAVRTRKLKVAGKKAVKTRTLKAAGTKETNTTKRRAAAWKAAATEKPRDVVAELQVVPIEVPLAAVAEVPPFKTSE
jgi:hypothetical protein